MSEPPVTPFYVFPTAGRVRGFTPEWVHFEAAVQERPVEPDGPVVRRYFSLGFPFFPMRRHQEAREALVDSRLVFPRFHYPLVLYHCRLVNVRGGLSSAGSYEIFDCVGLETRSPGLGRPFYPLPCPAGSGDRGRLLAFEDALLFGDPGERELTRGVYADWLSDRECFAYSDLIRERGLDFEELVRLQEKEIAE